jgi:hypothetical protein
MVKHPGQRVEADNPVMAQSVADSILPASQPAPQKSSLKYAILACSSHFYSAFGTKTHPLIRDA